MKATFILLLGAVCACGASADEQEVRTARDVEVVFNSLDRNDDERISKQEAAQERTLRRLALTWGVTPIQGKTATSTDEMFDNSLKGGLESGLVKPGDLVVITAGVPLGQSGSTNLVKVSQIPNK